MLIVNGNLRIVNGRVAGYNFWMRFWLLLILLVGCQATTPDAPTQSLATQVLQRPALAVITAVPTPQLIVTAVAATAVAIPTRPPTPVPPTIPPIVAPTAINGPAFTNLRTAAAADAAPQTDFPAGSEEVYALWDYHNMSANTRVMRLWLLDDQPWKVFESYWNERRYGRSGTISDTFIYDYEGNGLESGAYTLQLYIDGVFQGQVAFTILD